MPETIFALASGAGRAGIAVIRLSGEGVTAALDALGCSSPTPRKAARAKFIDPQSAEVVDDGLLLWFPAPHSFTGEDVAELHVHGGRAVINGIFGALSHLGLRPAEPGEFTRRAFMNGKLDLTQAEALADLVDAETRAQARQALQQMGGALKERYDDWRHRLVRTLAHLEAVIDFPDEDLPADVAGKIWTQVAAIAKEIGDHLDDAGRGERIRDGVSIAIIGPPNAGKSSLLNALARRDVAIVSATPGTTRDVIEVHLDLGGYAATIADTAGLREAADAIESEGIRRTHARAAAADLKIALFEASESPRTLEIDANTLVAFNKADLVHEPPASAPERKAVGGVAHNISVQTGFGMSQFIAALTEAVKARVEGTAGAPLTRARHRHALEECRAALLHAPAVALPELAAEDVRIAVRALGRITGRVDVEELLDVVFRDFCIGK